MNPMRQKVKDNTMLIFKQVETFKTKTNFLQRSFGYKCQFIRPSRFSHKVYEIFIPTLIESAERKIKVYEQLMRFIKK